MGSIWDQVVGGRPDDPAKKGPQTRRCKAGEVYRCWPLEDQAGWYLTHFLGQRTRPCLGEVCMCQSSETPVRTRWTGWILVAERFRPLLVRLLALTENCWDSCDALRNPTVLLRGRELMLRRPKGGARGKVYAEVSDQNYDPEAMPRLPYTQKDQLLRVWFSEKDGFDEMNQYANADWVVPDKCHEDRALQGPQPEECD